MPTRLIPLLQKNTKVWYYCTRCTCKRCYSSLSTYLTKYAFPPDFSVVLVNRYSWYCCCCFSRRSILPWDILYYALCNFFLWVGLVVVFYWLFPSWNLNYTIMLVQSVSFIKMWTIARLAVPSNKSNPYFDWIIFTLGIFYHLMFCIL